MSLLDENSQRRAWIWIGVNNLEVYWNFQSTNFKLFKKPYIVVPECFKSSWTCHNQIFGSHHILFYKIDAEMMSTNSLCLFNPNSRCIPFPVIGFKPAPDIDSSVYARERTWFSLTQEKGYTIYNQRLGSVSNCTILELGQPSTSQYNTSFIDSK
jgi:hypothetical protein